MSLRAGLRKGTKSSADGVAAFLRDSLGKTGRRLTSDPIRTSLGLLPSGPDPVGEWLVHRQSPGPYLGPKGPESKRDRRAFAGLVREHRKALVAVMPGAKARSASSRGCPGHPRPFWLRSKAW